MTSVVSPPVIMKLVSSAYDITEQLKDFLMSINKSLMKIINRIGPRIDPCGTPTVMPTSAERVLFTNTFCVLPDR